MVRKHIFVKGKVQGVSFRFHTHKKAITLNIRGWVRNLANGCVEVLAQGEKENMDSFIDWLHEGPPQARVDQLDIQDTNDELVTPGFRIREDGSVE